MSISFWIERRDVSWEEALLVSQRADWYPNTLLTIGPNVWYSMGLFTLDRYTFSYQPSAVNKDHPFLVVLKAERLAVFFCAERRLR